MAIPRTRPAAQTGAEAPAQWRWLRGPCPARPTLPPRSQPTSTEPVRPIVPPLGPPAMRLAPLAQLARRASLFFHPNDPLSPLLHCSSIYSHKNTLGLRVGSV